MQKRRGRPERSPSAGRQQACRRTGRPARGFELRATAHGDPPADRDREPVCEPHDSTGEPGAGNRHAGLCVQRRLVCSAGDSPRRGKNQEPRSLDSREEGNRISEAYRQGLPWGDCESSGRNASERTGGLESVFRRPSPQPRGEGSMGGRKLIETADPLRRGDSGSTMTRTDRATGEALLAPVRNHRSKVGSITGNTGKWAEGERVADGRVVAWRRGSARGAKAPCCWRVSDNMEGKDGMIKTSSGARPEKETLSQGEGCPGDWGSAGRGGLGGATCRKRSRLGRSHKPWDEAHRKAQCRKAACWV